MIEENKNSNKDSENNFEYKLIIGYLLCPDVVLENTLDRNIINLMLETGKVEVLELNLEDIYFEFFNSSSKSNMGLKVFHKNKEIHLDGFIAYGYMSSFHHKAYNYIVATLHDFGVCCLYSPEEENILNDKYLQNIKYSSHGIPIPPTTIGFSFSSIKEINEKYYPEKSIIKLLNNEYGADGVFVNKGKADALKYSSKFFWSQKYSLFQTFVDDSPGKSIRVLVVNGKSVACAEFVDKSGSPLSNINFSSELASLDSKMDSPKLNEYYDLAERTVKSIGNLLIAGVDIIDSPKYGLLVLEANLFPDIYQISESTNIPCPKIFATAFVEKVEKSLKK